MGCCCDCIVSDRWYDTVVFRGHEARRHWRRQLSCGSWSQTGRGWFVFYLVLVVNFVNFLLINCMVALKNFENLFKCQWNNEFCFLKILEEHPNLVEDESVRKPLSRRRARTNTGGASDIEGIVMVPTKEKRESKLKTSSKPDIDDYDYDDDDDDDDEEKGEQTSPRQVSTILFCFFFFFGK